MPDTLDMIMLRFPGPVTFYASRKKWSMVLLIGIILFGVALYFLFFDSSARIQTAPWYVKPAMWGCLVMGALGIPMAVTFILLPRLSKLVLMRNGFEFSHLFSKKLYLWADTSDFQIFSMPSSSKRAAYVSFDDRKQMGRMALLNKSIAGRNSGLPDTYGFTAEDLAKLMNQWREKALR